MILGKQDLEHLVGTGVLQVSPQKEFSAFSLDLEIGSFYEHNGAFLAYTKKDKTEKEGVRPEDMTAEQYTDTFLRTVVLPENGIILKPGHYLWQSKEHIVLLGNADVDGKGKSVERIPLSAEVVSRSSWARYGLRTQETDDALKKPGVDYQGKPLCTATVQTTSVIRSNDCIAQLVITAHVDFPLVRQEEIKRLITEGRMLVQREGKNVHPSTLEFDDDGIVLTMDPHIKVYTGEVIDPQMQTHAFEGIDISKKRVVFPRQTFFISSSAEYIEIPEGYVGYVKEKHFIRRSTTSIGSLGPDRNIFSTGYCTHPNAPYIGPRGVFKGTITLENYVLFDNLEFKPFQKQAILQLKRLSCSLEGINYSRYHGQNGATLSRQF